ncbi:5328_t:CDS:1, partial [Paraglomus occultum]
PPKGLSSVAYELDLGVPRLTALSSSLDGLGAEPPYLDYPMIVTIT